MAEAEPVFTSLKDRIAALNAANVKAGGGSSSNSRGGGSANGQPPPPRPKPASLSSPTTNGSSTSNAISNGAAAKPPPPLQPKPVLPRAANGAPVEVPSATGSAKPAPPVRPKPSLPTPAPADLAENGPPESPRAPMRAPPLPARERPAPLINHADKRPSVEEVARPDPAESRPVPKVPVDRAVPPPPGERPAPPAAVRPIPPPAGIPANLGPLADRSAEPRIGGSRSAEPRLAGRPVPQPARPPLPARTGSSTAPPLPRRNSNVSATGSQTSQSDLPLRRLPPVAPPTERPPVSPQEDAPRPPPLPKSSKPPLPAGKPTPRPVIAPKPSPPAAIPTPIPDPPPVSRLEEATEPPRSAEEPREPPASRLEEATEPPRTAEEPREPLEPPKPAGPPPVPRHSRPTAAATAVAAASVPAPAPPPDCLFCRDFSAPDAVAAQHPTSSLPRPDPISFLADALCSPFPSTTDKARAIFTWLHHNVAYDIANFLAGTVPRRSPQETIFTGQAVCEGYAAIFKAVADAAGLPCEIISGHGKGLGYVARGVVPFSSNHAWNAVLLESGWKLVDACWGAGSCNGNVYTPRLNGLHFSMGNEEFGHRHFPSHGEFFSDNRPSWEEYITSWNPEEMPRVYSDAADQGVDVGALVPVTRVANSHGGRFAVAKVCEHWDERRPTKLLLLITHRNGAMEPRVPQSDGRWWWWDVREGEAEGEVMLAALDTFGGEDATGVTGEVFARERVRKGYSFQALAAWQVS